MRVLLKRLSWGCDSTVGTQGKGRTKRDGGEDPQVALIQAQGTGLLLSEPDHH